MRSPVRDDAGRRTSEGQLRQNEEIEAIEIGRVQFVENGVGSGEVVDDVAHVGGELQASDPHGGKQANCWGPSQRSLRSVDETKSQPRPSRFRPGDIKCSGRPRQQQRP